MEEMYKCGYCGWMLNSACDNLSEHDCIRDIYDAEIHELVFDDKKVLTVVQKSGASATPVAKDLTEPGSSWEEGFIKYIQDRPPLYNLTLPLSERTNAKKQQLWQEISNIYGGKLNPDELQKKWKYLRDCYMRAKKKVSQYKPSGSQAVPVIDPGFRHYELMKFIYDSGSQQSTISSVSQYHDNVQDPTRPSPPTSSGVSTPLTSPTLTGSSSGTKKKKIEEKGLEKSIMDTLMKDHETDEIDGFLIRLGASLRRLPNKERALTEIKIMQLVYDIEFKLGN